MVTTPTSSCFECASKEKKRSGKNRCPLLDSSESSGLGRVVGLNSFINCIVIQRSAQPQKAGRASS